MIPSLRWGILGTGAIAKTFAKELPNSRTGVLHAVGSRTEESAAQFAKTFGISRVHGRYASLLADPEVDAVYISTPHPEHAALAIAAAEAGKHILCEKPMAMNHAEAMTVVEAARRHGVLLLEAFMYRFHPRTQRIAELVRDGAIGRVRLIRAAFSFSTPFRAEGRLYSNALGGGGILDVGCYTTSVARFVAGAAIGKPFADPVKVSGSAVLCETGVDTVAIASLAFPEGILGQLSCGVGLRQESDLLVIGEAGSLSVPAYWNPPGVIELRDGTGVLKEVFESGGSPHKYAVEADAVAEALPAQESPLLSWADSLGNMRVLDAWRRDAGVVHEIEQASHARQAAPVSGRPLRPDRWGEIPRSAVPGLDRPVSRLVLGVDNQESYAHLAAMADDFVERGGNAFDTAFIYGGGLMETHLGHWLRNRGIRDEVTLIVKGAHTPLCDPANLRRQFEISIERLGTDHADIYVMHRDNPDIPVGEFVDALDELRSAGRIRVYGGSNWSLARLREANAHAARHGREPFRVVSNTLSLARMMAPVWDGCVSAKGSEWREWFRESGAALFAWSSQARGYFADDRLLGSVSDQEITRCWDSEENQERRRRAITLAGKRKVTPLNIALAYVLNQPFPAFALIGPRTITEIRTSLPGLGVTLTPEELAWLDLAD